MKKEFSIKTIVAIGIGSAVFVILSRFATFPTGIANTNIDTAYGFLALIGALFGPVTGFLVGFIGHTIKDLTTYGAWWSWIICSGLIGGAYGIITKKLSIETGQLSVKEIVLFNVFQVLANALVWGLIAPSLDVLIYAEAPSKVYTQGLAAGLANSVTVGIIGSLLLIAYAKSRTQKGSLTKE